MPTTLNVHTIPTLKKFSNLVEILLPKSVDSTLWYRGAGRSSYQLSPSIHRHAAITDPEKVLELENQIIGRFNQRSVPFIHSPLDKKDDWEILFFMQHYGIPTRLLDWTENPFIALYFALTTAAYDIVNRKRVYSEDCAVWVLDPAIWNRESLKDFSFDKSILSVEDDFVNAFKPKTQYANIREKPVAIFGTHNSPRIVAQRGVFLVFGKKIKPMEDIYIDDSFPQDCLIKLVFPKNKISSLLNSLMSIGITDSAIYPDLEGLAKEIKRFYKFDL